MVRTAEFEPRIFQFISNIQSHIKFKLHFNLKNSALLVIVKWRTLKLR